MDLQKQLAAKASKFSHQWTKTLLAFPDLDETLNGRQALPMRPFRVCDRPIARVKSYHLHSHTSRPLLLEAKTAPKISKTSFVL